MMACTSPWRTVEVDAAQDLAAWVGDWDDVQVTDDERAVVAAGFSGHCVWSSVWVMTPSAGMGGE